MRLIRERPDHARLDRLDSSDWFPLRRWVDNGHGTMATIAVKTAIFSLGLALLVVTALAVYFAVGWTTFEPEDLKFGYTLLSTLFAVVWPASVPLCLAVLLLHRCSRPVAYLCAAVLAPLTLIAFLLAGLVQSEIFVVAGAVLSLPAWLALLAVRLRRPVSLPSRLPMI